ncbi:MAG: hypothetical protein U0Y68_16600 [Blastocatellia bacterium]
MIMEIIIIKKILAGAGAISRDIGSTRGKGRWYRHNSYQRRSLDGGALKAAAAPVAAAATKAAAPVAAAKSVGIAGTAAATGATAAKSAAPAAAMAKAAAPAATAGKTATTITASWHGTERRSACYRRNRSSRPAASTTASAALHRQAWR